MYFIATSGGYSKIRKIKSAGLLNAPNAWVVNEPSSASNHKPARVKTGFPYNIVSLIQGIGHASTYRWSSLLTHL